MQKQRTSSRVRKSQKGKSARTTKSLDTSDTNSVDGLLEIPDFLKRKDGKTDNKKLTQSISEKLDRLDKSDSKITMPKSDQPRKHSRKNALSPRPGTAQFAVFNALLKAPQGITPVDVTKVTGGHTGGYWQDITKFTKYRCRVWKVKERGKIIRYFMERVDKEIDAVVLSAPPGTVDEKTEAAKKTAQVSGVKTKVRRKKALGLKATGKAKRGRKSVKK